MSLREPDPLTVRLGADMDWTVTAQTVDSEGTAAAATGFSDADTIEAVVWSGDDSEPLFSPSAAWLDVDAAQITLTVSADDTADLTAGVYPLELTVISGGLRRPVLDGWLELTETPGVATAPPVYGTVQHMIDYGGGAWLPQLRLERGLANFTRQRARARSWLDTLILKAYRGSEYFRRDRNPWEIGYDSTMRGHLDDDLLIVTDETRELVAAKALEYVCRQQFTLAKDDQFPAMAGHFKRLADNLAKGYRAEVDVDGDTVAEFAFPLGVHSSR